MVPTVASQQIKKLREEREVTLRQLAEAVDLSPSFLSMWENGQVGDPASEKISEMERVLQAPPGEVFVVSTSGWNVMMKKVYAKNFNHVDVAGRFLEAASKQPIPPEVWQKWLNEIKRQ